MDRSLGWKCACAALLLLSSRALGDGSPLAAEKPRLVVLALAPAGGIEPRLAGAMTQAATAAASQSGLFSVISSSDIETMLGRERQRQLLGCSEESTSCLAELAGAMNARFVLSGTLAQLGSAFQLTLQTVDSERARPVGRSVRIADSLKALQAQLPYAVAEATATPSPTPPSRVLPITMLAVGAVLIVGGGLAGFDGLSRERALNQELTRGDTMPEVLRPIADYRTDASFAAVEKSIALGCLIGGAVLIGAGIFFMPSDGAGVRVAVVPSARGVGVAGFF